jgi:hypothetical protein
MARFNTVRVTPQVRSFVSTVLSAVGDNVRDEQSQLYVLGVSMFAGEKAFYETAQERDARFAKLVRYLAVAQPDWTSRFLGWLRAEAGIRTAAIMGAAEFVAARRDAGIADDDHTRRQRGLGRRTVDSVLQRADEPAELIAYWHKAYGRALPKAIRNGAADAAKRLWNERSLLKWDSGERAVRFADVLQLAHPAPKTDWQSGVFKHALDRRYGNDDTELPDNVVVLRYRRELMAIPVEQRRDWLRAAVATGALGDRLRDAGMTWESVAGWLQAPMDREAWEAVIPLMRCGALVRNLRNFDRAGVSDEIAARVAAVLMRPEEIAASKLFPYRFLAALRAAPSLRWSWPLETALNHSLANIPELPGRSLVLVDRSPSMWHQPMSEHSEMSWADGAAIFGAAVALRAEHADLVEFGHDSGRIAFDKSESVLRLVERFTRRSGTNIPAAISQHYDKSHHDRVIVITDEQTRPGFVPFWEPNGWYHNVKFASLDMLVDPATPVYTWNFGGYEAGWAPSGASNRHCFGGLTDNAFKIIPMLEQGHSADWPF